MEAETETEFRKKDGSASCLLGVYGPWTEGGEPEHMEPICMCRLSRTWHDGASGLWREGRSGPNTCLVYGIQKVCF